MNRIRTRFFIVIVMCSFSCAGSRCAEPKDLGLDSMQLHSPIETAVSIQPELEQAAGQIVTDPGVWDTVTRPHQPEPTSTPDLNDRCPNDINKTDPGVCGCGTPDTDSDSDGTPDCNDQCPNDINKTVPGVSGCGTPDTDSDSDGTPGLEGTCMELLGPADGSELPKMGKTIFTWGSVEGADVSYIIQFTPPEGNSIYFSTNDTSHSRYSESLPWGGAFNWRVIALDDAGHEICASQPFTFTKEKPPELDIATPIPEEEEEEEAISPSCVGPGCYD